MYTILGIYKNHFKPFMLTSLKIYCFQREVNGSIDENFGLEILDAVEKVCEVELQGGCIYSRA